MKTTEKIQFWIFIFVGLILLILSSCSTTSHIHSTTASYTTPEDAFNLNTRRHLITNYHINIYSYNILTACYTPTRTS